TRTRAPLVRPHGRRASAVRLLAVVGGILLACATLPGTLAHWCLLTVDFPPVSGDPDAPIQTHGQGHGLVRESATLVVRGVWLASCNHEVDDCPPPRRRHTLPVLGLLDR